MAFTDDHSLHRQGLCGTADEVADEAAWAEAAVVAARESVDVHRRALAARRRVEGAGPRVLDVSEPDADPLGVGHAVCGQRGLKASAAALEWNIGSPPWPTTG